MARRKNTRRIDPRYFIDEKMQIPTPVIKKCLALADKLERGPDTTGTQISGGGAGDYPEFLPQTPEQKKQAQAAYDEIQKQFDDARCMDTLERAEAYGDIKHNPLTNDPFGPSSESPGRMRLKR